MNNIWLEAIFVDSSTVDDDELELDIWGVFVGIFDVVSDNDKLFRDGWVEGDNVSTVVKTGISAVVSAPASNVVVVSTYVEPTKDVVETSAKLVNITLLVVADCVILGTVSDEPIHIQRKILVIYSSLIINWFISL